MTTLVLTVIGNDRAGLVSELSDVVAKGHGNWTTSQLVELAGQFAGIVQVEVPDEHAAALRTALEPLAGLLDIRVHTGTPHGVSGTEFAFDFVGDDRPGLVHQITDVVQRAGGSIASLTSAVTSAPMSGGELFTAQAIVRVQSAEAAADLRAALESIANELMVDCTFQPSVPAS